MFKYVGDGRFVPGVPARDLTNEEAEEFEVENSDIYEKVESPATKSASKGDN